MVVFVALWLLWGCVVACFFTLSVFVAPAVGVWQLWSLLLVLLVAPGVVFIFALVFLFSIGVCFWSVWWVWLLQSVGGGC